MPNKQKARDPKVDPAKGDVFRGPRSERTIQYRNGFVIAYRTTLLRNRQEWKTDSIQAITEFRKWAKDAEVIHAH